jgi:hypothetical protein
MKVLYVGSERRDAQAVAAALSGVAANVTVSWTSGLDHVAPWIDQNADLAALVMEAQIDRTSWRPVLAQVRGLASNPLVVVIVPEGTGPQFETLELQADEYLTKNQSLFHDLPIVVRRGIDARAQALIELERAARADLEEKLARARAALQEADERRRSETAAAAEQLAKHQAQYEIGLARAAATWEMVDEQLREAAIEVERGRRDQASAVVIVDRLSRREAELSSLLAEATAIRLDLERRLADIEGALTKVVTERDRDEKRHASAMADAAEQSRSLDAALRLAQQNLESQAADIERLTEREASLTSMLADATTSHDNLERRLAATEAASQDASARATSERLGAARRAAEREAELDGQIQQERATRATLEQAVADADAALRDAQQRHGAALTASAQQLADRQAQFDHELTETAFARDSFARRLNDAEVTLDQMRRDHQVAAADVERLTQREADLISQLTDVQADRENLAHQLAEAATAIAHAADREKELEAGRDRLAQQLVDAGGSLDQVRRDYQAAAGDVDRLTQREADLTAQLADAYAASHAFELQVFDTVNAMADAEERAAHQRAAAADRQADLEARLTQAIDTREILERTLTETRSAALEAERSLNDEIDALRARSLEQALLFEARLAEDRLDNEIRLAEIQEGNRELILEREAVQQSLATTEDQLRSLDSEHREACERFETARRDLQDTLDRQSTEYGAALAVRDHEIDQLRGKLTSASQAFEATKRRQEMLEGEADRVPQLVQQLDESRAESERLFQQTPLAMFRCTRDGVLTEANQAWRALVRRTIDELRGAGFAADVFESPNDLPWLVEHCQSTGTKESIETTLRRTDGGRLFVRLSACASASNVIEFVAEDLTRIRVLEDRLGQARRMEAVGRLASEVALTCRKLLNDAQQNARQWLKDVGGNAASRQEGETLLDELTRVTGYLQQLVAYGDKQTRTPALVDLNTVMRDLAPVLKHVAGDDVEVRLTDASSPLTVDVDTERVERLLVNLAAYGRERMQSGGRLTIEVGTIIVDRQFTAKYPNVRPGPHALITVTENKRAARAHGLLHLLGGSTAHASRGTVVQKSGVDLGIVQGLVGECGGHLWMKVQPLGDIVAKIRLPLLTSYDQTHSRALAAPGDRGRTKTRWFQH